jgi:hypothetical protein
LLNASSLLLFKVTLSISARRQISRETDIMQVTRHHVRQGAKHHRYRKPDIKQVAEIIQVGRHHIVE